MDPNALAQAVETLTNLGFGGGVLAALFLGWLIFRQVVEWRKGPEKRANGYARESTLADHIRQEYDDHRQILDVAKDTAMILRGIHDEQIRQGARIENIERELDHMRRTG